MGIIVRQSLKASFGFYLGALIGVVNQIFVSTHFLSVEQLAISRMLVENALLFATFSHLGAPFIADRFFGVFRNDDEQHHGFLLFLLTLPLLGGMVFTCAYYLFAPAVENYFRQESPQLIPYHFLVIPFTFFWVYMLVLEAYCRNHSRIAIPSFVREVFLRAANMLLILMFGLGWYSFDLLLYLILAAYGLAVIILLFYTARLGKLYLRKPGRELFTRSQLKTMLGYGGFTLLGGVGVNIILTIDRSMLAGEKGLISAGIFIIATYIAGIIEIPKKAISQISIPYLSDALRTENRTEITKLTQKSALHQLLAGGIFFLLIWANIDEIFSLLPKGDTYEEGKYVVLLIGVVKLLDVAMGLQNEIIMYSKYYRWTTFLIISASLLSVLLNLWLIPVLGYNGAALAAVATTLTLSACKFWIVWDKFAIHPVTRQTFQLIAVLILIYLLSLLFPRPEGNWLYTLVMIGAKSLVLVLVYAAIVYKMNFSPEANQILGKIRLFLKK